MMTLENRGHLLIILFNMTMMKYQFVINLMGLTLLLMNQMSLVYSQFGAEYPPLCNEQAAIQCEYDFLQCRLFGGPADDPETMCRCGEDFYGECLRKSGCVMHKEFDKLGKNEVYLKKCVDHVIKYDCPSTLMCAVNCASEGKIDGSTAKLMPFNNYGDQALRLRFCNKKLHYNQLEKYSIVVSLACKDMPDFLVCERWIPPFTYTIVSIPSDTTYMEIDYCDVSSTNENYRFCHKVNPPPTRLYGSKVLFPSTFDVPQTNVSVCKTDGTITVSCLPACRHVLMPRSNKCLGSFCDSTFRPRVCSPKTLFHIEHTGKYFLTVPFE